MRHLSSVDKLQVVLSGAKATNDCPVTAEYDIIGLAGAGTGQQSTDFGAARTVTNGVTAVDVITAPSAGLIRQVKRFSVYNKDTAAITITVQLSTSGSAYEQIKVTLAVGQSLHWNPDTQWRLDTGSNSSVGDFTVSGILTLASVTNGITAFAGGGQASAVQLVSQMSRVTTVGTAADSVKLPAATAGAVRVVINAAAANAMNVFPATGEVINALAANTAISVAANKVMCFFCAVAGTWNSLLTA